MVLPVDGLLVFNPNLFGYLSRLLLGVHVEGLFTKWALKNAVRAIEYLINVLFTKGSPRWGFVKLNNTILPKGCPDGAEKN